MKPLAHVATTLQVGRDGLHAWAKSLLAEGGLDLQVLGMVPVDKQPPSLVLLPYQTVLESQHTNPTRVLLPYNENSPAGGLPQAWSRMGKELTAMLLRYYPSASKGQAGLGPISPRPPLSELPGPLADWYRAHPEFSSGPEHGLLPMVAWRQPFSLVVRFAAMVIDTSNSTNQLDLERLKALGVVAAGVRHRRYFEVQMPHDPVDEPMRTLIKAFAESGDDVEKKAVNDLLARVTQDRRTAVGIYPHHELADDDIAHMMQALQRPMQPTVVFALRLALGAGPDLSTGALPAVPPVEKVEDG